MKVLHTADWHLGQRLAGRDRAEEHRRFLAWLVEVARARQVRLLLVAGDVFDSAHPSHATVRMYYEFLRDLTAGGACHAIIVAGNHDSPAQLNAPRELLRQLHIHVVGSPSANRADDIIHVPPRAEDGGLPLAVCAVPFLRERDLAAIVVGEDARAREERMRQALAQFYAEMRLLVQPDRERGWPILAMGHLAIQSSARAEEDRELYLGHLDAVGAAQLPADFDYFALGHLHQAHAVAGQPHMRYSGSPVAVSFAEASQTKEVTLLEFVPGQPVRIESLPVPQSRPLHRFSGSLATFAQWLGDLPTAELTPWIEVALSAESGGGDFAQQANDLAARHGCEVLKVIAPEIAREATAWTSQEVSLLDLRPEQVFAQRCRAAGLDLESTEGHELAETFAELLAGYEAQRLELATA